MEQEQKDAQAVQGQNWLEDLLEKMCDTDDEPDLSAEQSADVQPARRSVSRKTLERLIDKVSLKL